MSEGEVCYTWSVELPRCYHQGGNWGNFGLVWGSQVYDCEYWHAGKYCRR